MPSILITRFSGQGLTRIKTSILQRSILHPFVGGTDGGDRAAPPVTAAAILDTHTHPFSVRALVVQGEMWLTVGTATRHLKAGDRFELAAEVPHVERYGAEGATCWVARRNRPKAPGPKA